MDVLHSKFEKVIRNLTLLADDVATGREQWESRPNTIEFSTNNICNLRCVMCAQHDGVPARKVNRDVAAKVLDETLREATLLVPLALSEPTIGDLDLYLEKCEQHDSFLDVITNGTLLTRPILERMLPRTHRLSISVESCTKENYEYIRQGARFDDFVKRARLAFDMAAERNVRARVTTILMRPVYKSLPAFIRWCKEELHCNEVQVSELLGGYPRHDQHTLEGHATLEELLELRDECSQVAAELGMNLIFMMPPPLGLHECRDAPHPRGLPSELAERMQWEIARQNGHICPHVLGWMKVDPDGTAYPCCRAPKELAMGNLFRRSLDEVWNGVPYQRLRRAFMDGKPPHVCQTCNVFTQGSHYRKPGEPGPGRRAEVIEARTPLQLANSEVDR